jgi:tRNA modification GTPase
LSGPIKNPAQRKLTETGRNVSRETSGVSDHDTIAAIATAPGRGGIGVVRISGSNLKDYSHAFCGKSLLPRVATLCHFTDDAGVVIDQGIALYFPAPRSYTGDDVIELQGHGGPIVLQQLLKRCLTLGARIAEPGEFSKRAFLNGKMDLAQAEGVADLIDAATEQAARAANRSIQGEFSTNVLAVAQQVMELRALTEATLDFPEEDIDTGTRDEQMARLAAVQVALDLLLAAARQGSLLREGARVVLAGRPNAGKSSLLNRLAGEEVAIVTDIPGTTRDTVRQTINLNGVPIHVIDTAGLRESIDTVERIGIARTWEAIQEADLAVLVVDATLGETGEDQAILDKLPPAMPCVRVYNKCDLLSPTRLLPRLADRLPVSAKTGAGIDDLRDSIAQAIGWRDGGEGLFMARARHLAALRQADAGLAAAQQQLAHQELFAEELRKAHEAMMTITGEVTPDDLLGEIFSRFCIGK